MSHRQVDDRGLAVAAAAELPDLVGRNAEVLLQARTPLLQQGLVVNDHQGGLAMLGSGIAPLADMVRAGVALAVGLDGLGLDDDQDFLRELRLAWTLCNHRVDPAAPPLGSREIWHLGTVGGVRAVLGGDVRSGLLAPGALADLVLLRAPRFLPPPTPQGLSWLPDLLLRTASREHVRHVMVHGRWVVRDGRSTTLDEEAVALRLAEDLRGRWADQPPEQAGVMDRLTAYIRSWYERLEFT